MKILITTQDSAEEYEIDEMAFQDDFLLLKKSGVVTNMCNKHFIREVKIQHETQVQRETSDGGQSQIPIQT